MDDYSTNDRMNKWFTISFIEKFTEINYKLRDIGIGWWGMHSLVGNAILHHNIVIVPKASYVIGTLQSILRHQTMYLQ